MSVLVVGMSHRSAPVSLLEQLSMADGVVDSTTSKLLSRSSLTEALIVSTCNRLEVYAVTNSFHTGVNDVVEVLAEVSGVGIDTLRGYLYVRYADAAAEHMLVVASGLDSMVIGEQQIIGQVRTAYQYASEIGSVGPALHSLTQTALHTGKRVHSETEIDDAGASMVSFAFDEALAAMERDDARGLKALILGAGAMSSLAATHLGRLGVQEILVANRTRSRAERLAEHAREAGVAARSMDFDDRAEVLTDVDIVVSATGAGIHTIQASDIPRGATLTLVDLSMPRDIDDTVADIPGVQLVNIERLHRAGREDPDGQGNARAIVREELDTFTSAQRVRDVVPALSALRKQAAGLVEGELNRLQGRTPHMDEDDWNEVARTVRRVVDKLLHEPTVRVKELAARSGTVSYDSALQELFGLEIAMPVSEIDEIDAGTIVSVVGPSALNQEVRS